MRDLYDDLMDRLGPSDPWGAVREDVSEDDPTEDDTAEWESLANILDEEDGDDFPVEFDEE